MYSPLLVSLYGLARDSNMPILGNHPGLVCHTVRLLNKTTKTTKQRLSDKLAVSKLFVFVGLMVGVVRPTMVNSGLNLNPGILTGPKNCGNINQVK